MHRVNFNEVGDRALENSGGLWTCTAHINETLNAILAVILKATGGNNIGLGRGCFKIRSSEGEYSATAFEPYPIALDNLSHPRRVCYWV